MSCPFNEQQLTQLQAFIEMCKTEPQILNHPKLSFFKDYLMSLGVTIPTATFGTKHFTPSGDGNAKAAPGKDQSASQEKSDSESDVELDMDGVIEGDLIDENQIMGDPDKVPIEEDCDHSDEKRTEAMRAFSEQQFEVAIKLYSEAILLNPQSALLFAKRGQVFLKLNKPNACIKDCTRALELNCDSAAAYKFRGRAYRLLGKFEEASHDLCESLKIDYDEQTNEWLNDVKPNAEKLRQHKFRVLRKEGKKREKIRRHHEMEEARCRAEKVHAQAKDNVMGGARASAPSEGFTPDFGSLLNDPEILATFQDPEIITAFADLSSNPSNYSKYQNHPKIIATIQKLQEKLDKGASKPFSGGNPGFGGVGAGGLGGPGGPGAPGGPGGPGGPGTGPKQPTEDDVGLD